MIIPILAASFIGYICYDNYRIQLNKYHITSDKLPKQFDGYKILLMPDIHNANYGDRLEKLISSVKADMVAIPGDIEEKHTNYENSYRIVKCATNVAPTYFSTGNHEEKSQDKGEILSRLANMDVIVLNNDGVKVNRNNESIYIFGASDTIFRGKKKSLATLEKNIKETVSDRNFNRENFNILLMHRANFFDMVSNYNFDVVLSGHVHGGHVRLPLINRGLISSDFEIFPKYTSGVYKKGKSTLVASRGISKKIYMPRIFNGPELVLVELNKS